MAKYKHYDYCQAEQRTIRFDRQILPGTFEYTLNELIDSYINLPVFAARYKKARYHRGQSARVAVTNIKIPSLPPAIRLQNRVFLQVR